MTNYFIYAKDFSGSTHYDTHYHSNGLQTLEQFKKDVERIKTELLVAGEPPTNSKIIYLHWGKSCYEVDEDITRTKYIERQGDEPATEPISIVKWIQENYNICSKTNKIKLLYIITDGLIDYQCADECFKQNENKHYEMVVFHAFNQNLDAIDLSVAASFFKSRCMIYRNYELFDNIDLSNEFDYDKINVNNFAAEKDQLKSYIRFKFINKMNHDALALREIDKLKKLRNRLFAELSLKSQKSDLDTKDRNIFLFKFARTKWYKNLTTDIHNEKVDIEKCISTLINYIVSEKKSYSFDELKFETKFDNPIEEQPIVDVNFPAEQEIQFPDIILDDDKGIPVVILTEFSLLDKIIFHRTSTTDVSPASFSKFKSAMECPLFLVTDSGISESIGYFYTLNAYKQMLVHNTKTEPRTRRPFHGGLVLIDTDHFDNYNDYILSATYFDFKKVKYNIGLFYFVLWKNCENKEWMDKNVVEQFKKYAMRRINKTVCKIGLSSLPLDPDENTSLLTALWYCVELSSCIFKNDIYNFMHERLRMFYGVAHSMIEILKWFNYDLDLESIEKRRNLISNVMILKKIPNRTEKLYYLLKKIFKTEDGFLVSEIERPQNLYILNFLKLDHKGMLHDDVIEEKVHLNDYVHLMHYVGDTSKFKAEEDTFVICEKTFRPFFIVDQNKSFYTELVKITKKVVINNDDDKDRIEVTYNAVDSLEFSKILSLYNLFINCVKDSEKYPNLPEYIDYILKRKKFYCDLVTIFPSNVYVAAVEVYGRYQRMLNKVHVNEFIKVCKAYVNRSERIKAEEIIKFSNDREINEFISSEELKVHLRKKPKKMDLL
ncbi:unnamed protein product, partial [Brenthis ino]